MRADGGAATAAADERFEEADARPRTAAAAGVTGAPELRLGAWEGPLDLLLELARARKVDLAGLSILDLAEQFGAAVQAALASGHAPLSRLGDWLVMAAQLAWLRSRLLLPEDSREGEQARRDAEALRRRLADRAHARRLADWLEARHQLGRDVFARGVAVEAAAAGMDRAVPTADIAALFRACLAVLERSDRGGSWRPEPLPLWRVPDALARLRRMLPALPEGGTPLERFLPEMGADEAPGAALRRRAALASTLLAALELEREGSAALSQAAAFARIAVAPAALLDRACRGAHAAAPAPGAGGLERGRR
jgi:segregation and condensation protein A